MHILGSYKKFYKSPSILKAQRPENILEIPELVYLMIRFSSIVFVRKY